MRIRSYRRFNAARGFVGGAAKWCHPRCILSFRFQCRTRLCGWCSHTHIDAKFHRRGRFNAARGFVGGAASIFNSENSFECCFNAARGFVGGAALHHLFANEPMVVSMPHAALWVVQPTSRLSRKRTVRVSMPHAALWVVQPRRSQPFSP